VLTLLSSRIENTLLPKGSGERRRHKGKAPGEVVQIGTRWYDEWIEDNMPDLTGKVCVFTGGDSGIGYWAVNALAGANCLVVLASRYMKEGKKAKQQILAAHPDAKIEVFKMENMDLSSVRAFAKAFLAKHDQLDFLIDNAGVMAKPLIQSKDGHDIQFQTNHLAHFLLTKLLWERLVSSTGQSRVVIQSSVTHRLGSLVFDRNRIEHPTYDWGWFGLNVLIKHVALPAMGFLEIDHWSRYGVSKLCNVLMMRELQRKIEKKALTDKVLSLACHPGWASTPLHRGAAHAMKDWRKMSALYGQSAADGSLPLLMAVVSSDVQNGDFLGPTGRGELEGPPGIVKVGGNGNNEKMAKSLWEYSEECIGEPFEI
jgi:NAD(P)-dependent dehydrogenase (short-subunit alcohol dehydrogenase family)